MAAIKTIRTTAFRLSDELFGTVHVYRPSRDFTRVWQSLEEQWGKSTNGKSKRYLPYGGLAVALRCLSGDFVALERNVERERAVVLSRKPIPPEQLELAFAAWESTALGRDDMPLSRRVDGLAHEEVEVASLIQRRPGQPPTFEGGSWPWSVAVWEVAYQLAAIPLRTDAGSVNLRIDSNAALLTWDDLVFPSSADAGAMHKIVPRIITMPGVEDPVVSLQSSLVRLAPSWRGSFGSKYAWASLGGDAPILRARVRHTKVGEEYISKWDDGAADVLKAASLQPLPDANGGPSLRGSLRSGYHHQPTRHSIGKGAGTWFHECVAHHARLCLGDLGSPIALESRKRSWPSKSAVASRPALNSGSGEAHAEIRFLMIYANSITRRRMRDGLAHVLKDEADNNDVASLNVFRERLNMLEDGETLRYGPIEVRFVSPPNAERGLFARDVPERIVTWLDTWIPGEIDANTRAVALIETDESAANGDDEFSDPKKVLRGALGARGIVTQFITAASEPDQKRGRGAIHEGAFADYPAANSVSDLMRSGGFFLRPFPAHGVEPGTLLVGIYGTRVTRKKSGWGRPSYMVNLVAAVAGTRDAWGYVPSAGWKLLGDATAAFHGSDHNHDKNTAKRIVETAVEQLRLKFRGSKTVLLFDALGCRRFWSCLQDTSEAELEPWMVSENHAVVRVRTTAGELVRPAGAHDWSEQFCPAKHTNFRPMSIVGAEGNSATVLLSGSAIMDTGRRARGSTRYGADDVGLREDWHSLGTTEILVLESGAWDHEKLVEQVAMLCRVAPTWDRVLRWPSPIHLARAVVRDHPFGSFWDADKEGEEVGDDRWV